MSANRPTGYHFRTLAQWQTCLMDQASASARAGEVSVAPFTRYLSLAAPAFASDGAFAPACTRGGVTVWRDGAGHLLRTYGLDVPPESYEAPAAIGAASRIVGTGTDLWVIGQLPRSLECFDAESLSRRLTVDLSPARVLDLAADQGDGIVALLQDQARFVCVRISSSGMITERITLAHMADTPDLVRLAAVGAPPGAASANAASGRLAVLTRGPGLAGDRIHWFERTAGALRDVTQLAMYAPCFEAAAIAGDPTGRLFVAGTDNHDSGPRSHVLVFDAEGILVDDISLHMRPTGIATCRNALLVTAQGGLYALPVTTTVPDDGAAVQATIVTPALEAADVPDGRRWLRVEVIGNLPAGATLQIQCGMTDDAAVRDRLQALAADTTTPIGRRIESLLAQEGVWQAPILLQGSAAAPSDAGVPLAAPLHDIRARYLWVCLTLVAGAGVTLPSVSHLSILYPGHTLMERMPAIYQSAEATPGNFLRSLVGVLETTTHSLDARIAGLGASIHPDTASPAWLDYVARWLGLPWDDRLDPAQKRAIVGQAEALARGRGTRAGLATLLSCLLPGPSSRYRIRDFTVDYGIAMAGGDACPGSRLPALLGGPPRSTATLDGLATLGWMRLPCNGAQADPFSRFVGRLVVDIAATPAEKTLWMPWLADVLAAMVPLTTRLRIRWLGPGALADSTLGDGLVLDDHSSPRLDADAVVGHVALPEGASMLPARTTRDGPALR